ncbi:MAG: ABC transporter substrate-binding protein, partial [Chloroflexota bacterium]
MGQRVRSKHGLFFGVIGLMLLALQGVSAQSQAVFHIGVLDNERGSISNGARLAAQEINAAGGVRGADGTMFQLELAIEPSNGGSTLDQAITDLKMTPVEAVLGPETTDEVVNGLDALQSLGVPVITPATGDTILTSDTSGLIFRSRAADALQGQALASYLISDYKLSPVATVQLDVASTASVVGFTTAASTLGVTPDPALILHDPSELSPTVATIINADPAVVVAFGSPDSASALYNGLRTGAWKGLFAYNDAFDPAFSDTVPFDQLNGIVAVTTWAFTADDLASTTFLNSYIHAYGELPDAITAASYDSIKVIAAALAQPGNLRDNLSTTPQMPGVQGILKAQDVGTNDLSNNVTVVRLGDLGAPLVLARYQGNQRLPLVGIVTPPANATLIPTMIPPTATPQGVVLTIKSSQQNVRSGPGDNYDILGQLTQGEQAAVIGASLDYTWVVINFRGTQGWLIGNLLTVSGDLRSVPVIPAPPTPIPVVTATPNTPQTTDLIIVSASITPNPVLPNQTFTVTINVGTIGTVAAGP